MMRKTALLALTVGAGFASVGYAWNEGIGPFAAENCPSISSDYTADPAQYNLDDIKTALDTIDLPFAEEAGRISQFEASMSAPETDTIGEVREAFSTLLAGIVRVEYSYGDAFEDEIFNKDDGRDVLRYKEKIIETAEQIVRLPDGLLEDFKLVEDLKWLPDNPTGVVLPDVSLDFGLFSFGVGDTHIVVIGDTKYPKLTHEFAHIRDFETCSPVASPAADKAALRIFEKAEAEYYAGKPVEELAYSDYPFNTGDPVTGVLEYKAVSYEDAFFGAISRPGTLRAQMRDLTTARLNSWFAGGADAFGPYFALMQYCGKPNADADIIGPDEFMQKCLGLAS